MPLCSLSDCFFGHVSRPWPRIYNNSSLHTCSCAARLQTRLEPWSTRGSMPWAIARFPRPVQSSANRRQMRAALYLLTLLHLADVRWSKYDPSFLNSNLERFGSLVYQSIFDLLSIALWRNVDTYCTYVHTRTSLEMTTRVLGEEWRSPHAKDTNGSSIAITRRRRVFIYSYCRLSVQLLQSTCLGQQEWALQL